MADGNIVAVFEEGAAPGVEDEPLAGEEVRVRAHWLRWLPRRVASLQAQGPDALDQAVRDAWWNGEINIGVTLAQNPSLHCGQVMELFRETVYPTPEPKPKKPKAAKKR